MNTLKKKLRKFIKQLGRSKFIVNLAGLLAYVYVLIVGKTSSFDIKSLDNVEKELKSQNGGLLIIWHARALMLPYFCNNRVTVKALVSPHNDGRIIAKLLNKFGIQTIDGSSNQNANRAAVEIYKELSKGTVVAIIPDGPRGPRMTLNKSVIYFAQKTGKPIIGLTYSAKKAKIMHQTWDAMMLPKPFSKGVVLATSPIYIPQNINEQEAEKARKSVENALNEITYKTDKLCNIEKITPGVAKLKKNAKPTTHNHP